MLHRMGWAALWTAAATIGLVGCAETQLWPGTAFDAVPDQSGAAASASVSDREDFRRPANDYEKSRLSLARLTERRGQEKIAQQLYEKVLAENPRSIVANHRLAVLAARQGKMELADEHFQAALQLAAPTVELLADIGYCYYLQNRPAEAEKSLNEALQLDPNHKTATNNLAMVLGEQGRFDESLAAFQRLGTEAESYANLAYIYSQLGQYDQAQDYYSRALSLDPTLRTAAKAMLQLAERQRGRTFEQPPTPTLPADPEGETEPGDVLVKQVTPPALQRESELPVESVPPSEVAMPSEAAPSSKVALPSKVTPPIEAALSSEPDTISASAPSASTLPSSPAIQPVAPVTVTLPTIEPPARVTMPTTPQVMPPNVVRKPATRTATRTPIQNMDGMISVYDKAGSSLPAPQRGATVSATEQMSQQMPQQVSRRNQVLGHAPATPYPGTFRPVGLPKQQPPSAYQPNSANAPQKPALGVGDFRPLARPTVQDAMQAAFQNRLDAVQIGTGAYLPSTGQGQ